MFDFLESILAELKDIPGLSFLKRVHYLVSIKITQFRHRVQHVQNRKNDVVGYSRKLKQLTQSAKGSKRREQ